MYVMIYKSQNVSRLSVRSYIGKCSIRVTARSQLARLNVLEFDSYIFMLFGSSNGIVGFLKVTNGRVWKTLLAKAGLHC